MRFFGGPDNITVSFTISLQPRAESFDIFKRYAEIQTKFPPSFLLLFLPFFY